MKKSLKTFLLCLAIPLLTGGLSAFLTCGAMADFRQLNQPPLSPPGILFPVVWSILYALMGIASYLILTAPKENSDIPTALKLYGIQLAVNALWPLFFFRLKWYLFSFFWLLLLWLAILVTIRLFGRICPAASRLLLPYLIWVTFAGYLNLGIYWLN
ncbi:MAG: tryptophan-rich sensory protein [Lachnospiraceae bacterium]|nr:tryptophan-rich sensory protein [Lachnospiraceae bacterium]